MGRLLEWQLRSISRTDDPAMRFKGLYLFVGFSVSGLLSFVGPGLLIGGTGATTGKALQVLLFMEGGRSTDMLGLRLHGAIMLTLGLLLAWTLLDFRLATRRVLMMVAFYTTLTSLLIFASWVTYGLSWSAPWFYLLPAVLSLGLLFFAPPLGDDGQRYGVTTTGSDRA